MRVLVTRPEPDASREADALAARGHQGVKAPLLVIEPVEDVALELDGAQALIVTSRNALRALAGHRDLGRARKLRLFAVGGATASAARELGFAEVTEGPGNGAGLAELIEAEAKPADGVLIHLAGETLAFDLKSALEAKGFSVRQPVLYRSVQATQLPLGSLEPDQGRQARRRHPDVAAHRPNLRRFARPTRPGNARKASGLLLHLQGGSRGAEPARIRRAHRVAPARGRCPCARQRRGGILAGFANPRRGLRLRRDGRPFRR